MMISEIGQWVVLVILFIWSVKDSEYVSKFKKDFIDLKGSYNQHEKASTAHESIETRVRHLEAVHGIVDRRDFQWEAKGMGDYVKVPKPDRRKESKGGRRKGDQVKRRKSSK